MKNRINIFWIILSLLPSFTCEAQDTIFNYNPQWTSYYFRDDIDHSFQLDTTISKFNRFNPAEEAFGYLHLGQLGAPATAMFLTGIQAPEFDIGIHQFDRYWLNSNGVKLYDTKHPYTSVYYHQGSKNEIKASIVHTQNILPQWNVGAAVNRLRTDGFYQRQLSRITDFDAFTRYHSKNGVYQLEAAYVLNSIKVNENGGIADVNILTDSSVFDKTLIPVRLDSAMNSWKSDEFFIQNNIQLGSWEEVKKNDSVTIRMIKPKVRLQHLFEWERRSYFFTDAAIDNDFYPIILLDSVHTRDSLKYDRFSNQISMILPPSQKTLLKNFNADVFFRNDVYNIQSLLPDQQVTSGIAGATIQKYFERDSSGKNRLSLEITGQYNLLDFNKGDYLVSGQSSLKISQNSLVSATVSVSKNHPSLIEQNYFSNHFYWANDFNSSLSSSVKLFFRQDKLKFFLSAELFRVQDYIYWNTAARPAQYGEDLKGFAIFLQKNFKFKSLHLDNELRYQHYNPDSIVSFPAFFSRHSFYFENKLFKGALTSILGIDIRYNSNYFAPAYLPETGQFYLQHISELNYYPIADLFISIKVKGVRAFAMLQNIDKDLFAPVYFSAYRYPMPDRSFRLGLEWVFWN